MKVKVTQKHIDASKIFRDKTDVNPTECCPISLALWDNFPWKNISVGWCSREIFYISILDPDKNYKQIINTHDVVSNIEDCSRFAEKYDNGNEVKPFEFELKQQASKQKG